VGIRDSNNPGITFASNAWATRSKSSAYAGSFRTSSAKGAWAAVSFVGEAIAWVAPVGPGKGTAKVEVDGGAPILVSLDRSTARAQQIVWQSAALPAGPHSVVITIVSGQVAMDAILILG
jgi:hypothetical protein